MSCEHEQLGQISQKELKEKWRLGTETIDCPDCGLTFYLQHDHFRGKMLLVRTTQKRAYHEGETE